MRQFFSVLGLAIFLPFCSAAASDSVSTRDAMNNFGNTDTNLFAGTWQTTVTRNNTSRVNRSKPRSIGKRKTNIAVLRAKAIRISMKYLPRLRPYASNYPRMVSVVRAYWRKNAANPNAARLTKMILQHVQEKYRFLVRSKLHNGVSKGIKVLKNKLHNS